jgi:hypothetical protein
LWLHVNLARVGAPALFFRRIDVIRLSNAAATNVHSENVLELSYHRFAFTSEGKCVLESYDCRNEATVAKKNNPCSLFNVPGEMLLAERVGFCLPHTLGQPQSKSS